MSELLVDDPPGVKRSISDVPISLFNSIVDTHLAAEEVDRAINSVVDDARARNVPVMWWISPSTRPANMGKHLEKHGFIFDDESPGMAVVLSHLNDELSKPEGLTVQLDRGEAALRQWSRTMLEGFEVTSNLERGVDNWTRILLHADPETMMAYTGWLDGKPVATSFLFLAAGVAGIYCVAVIPKARRKGIGAWMTLQPLLDARLGGYKVGVIEASEMGQSVYLALGFQEICKISSYHWAPDQK